MVHVSALIIGPCGPLFEAYPLHAPCHANPASRMHSLLTVLADKASKIPCNTLAAYVETEAFIMAIHYNVWVLSIKSIWPTMRAVKW